MRNLKNFNHWITELRDLARNLPVMELEDDGTTSPISKYGIKMIFNKSSFKDEFTDGLTPQEALDNEMERFAIAPLKLTFKQKGE
jgi:hypothetical protein